MQEHWVTFIPTSHFSKQKKEKKKMQRKGNWIRKEVHNGTEKWYMERYGAEKKCETK